MTKSDLRNGMFGKLSDGDIFVVVGDKLIYEKGQMDDINDMNDDMVFCCSGNKIMELYDAECFKEVQEDRGKLIWKRSQPEVEAKPVKTGAIKITEEQFFEAVKKANETFMEIGSDIPGTKAIEPLLGMQNILFGELIGAVLFNEEAFNEAVESRCK